MIRAASNENVTVFFYSIWTWTRASYLTFDFLKKKRLIEVCSSIFKPPVLLKFNSRSLRPQLRLELRISAGGGSLMPPRVNSPVPTLKLLRLSRSNYTIPPGQTADSTSRQSSRKEAIGLNVVLTTAGKTGASAAKRAARNVQDFAAASSRLLSDACNCMDH